MGQVDTSSSISACQVCGRRDESLRWVAYPYVISFLVITYRRVFEGVWCARHRWPRLLLASVITSTLGWLGIPFGFIYTPIVLWSLARGGVRPVDRNRLLLKMMADDAARRGDLGRAIRCLEAALEFGDDDDVRSRLSQLYLTQGAMPEAEAPIKQALRIGVVLFAALLISGLVGLLDSLVTNALSDATRKASSLYIDILSWAILICLAFIGGLIIFGLIRWALAHNRSTSPILGTVLALVSAGSALYGVLTGEGLGYYLSLNSQVTFHEVGVDLISTVLSVLTRGGGFMAQKLPTTTGLAGALWVIVLTVLGAYYLMGGLLTAKGAVNWQQRIVAVRNSSLGSWPERSLGAWLGLGIIAGALVAAPLLMPQHEIVDYFAALDHLRAGNQHLDASELDQAVTELEAARALKPNLTPVLSTLGWAYLYQGEVRSAEHEFTTALQIDPNWADAHHGLGVTYYSRQNMGRAVDELTEAVRLAPDNTNAHLDLGLVCVETGDYDKGAAELQLALQQDNKLANAHLYLSRVYFAQDKMAEGLKELDAAIELAPNSGQLQGEAGMMYFLTGETPKAIAALQKAVKLLPEQSDVHAALGAALAEQGRIKEAQPQVDLALKLDAESFLSHYGAGVVAAQRGDMPQAETYLRRAVQLNPKFTLAGIVLAQVYESEAKFDWALEQYQKISAAQPDWAPPHLYRAAIYYQLDQSDRVQQELAQARKVTQDEANTHFVWAIYYMMQRDLTKSEQELLQAEHLAQGNKDAIYQALADLYAIRQQYDEAHKWAKQITQDVKAHNAWSDIYIEQQLLDKALTELKQAQTLAPEDGSINSALSFVYFYQNKIAEALTEAERAVQKWPYYAKGYVNLALVRHVRREFDQALVAAQRAIELEPKNDRAHYVLGLIYLDGNQKDKARAEFEKFLALYQERAYVRDWKVKAQEYLKQLQP